MGVPRLTNNQLRPSSIRAMKRAGKSDRFICTVTKHKRESTLANYDPEPELDERFEGAHAIMKIKEKPKISVKTSTITKTVSKTSVSREDIGRREAFKGALDKIADQG